MSHKPEVSCYLSVRMKNKNAAACVAHILSNRYGIHVENPCTITPSVPHSEMPAAIAQACYDMMARTLAVVLISGDGTDFGLDCATELGYTIASHKPIYVMGWADGPFTLQENLRQAELARTERSVLSDSIPSRNYFVRLKLLAEALRSDLKFPQ